MTADVVHETNPFLRRVDTILAEEPFDDLLRLTLDACITAPGRFEKNLGELQGTPEKQKSCDAKLLEKLGLWGLRTAWDIQDSPLYFFWPEEDVIADCEEDELRGEEVIRPVSPIIWPELFGSRINPKISHGIEALGKSIIDEAFICLGVDALDNVRAWNEATSPEQKENILIWLFKRVDDISTRDQGKETDNATTAEDGAEENEDASYFYHPARLSPRFIGQFPDNDVEPTCLARSILVASFFEKAGIPYLHCGVVQSDAQGVRENLSNCLASMEDVAERLGLGLPDIVKQKYALAYDAMDELNTQDSGFHAVVLAKIDTQSWELIDVNYNTFALLPEDDSIDCDEIYEQLKSFRELVPGMEHTISRNYSNLVHLPLMIFEKNLHEQFVAKEVEDYLATCDDHTSAVALSARFIEPFFMAGTEGTGDSDGAAEDLRKELLRLLGTSDEELLYTLADDVMVKQVFPDAKDGDISLCLKRCKTDESYRARRAEDLKLAPLFAIVTMTNSLTNLVLDCKIPSSHHQLEVGLPHYRIGAAVLSDFAMYCGDELPLSFWASYWPSHVAVVEHRANTASDHQKALLRNHMAVNSLNDLQYMKNYGIIREFLGKDSKKEPSEGGESDEE